MLSALKPKEDHTLGELLVGQHVALFPYAQGFGPRDLLWRVWVTIEADGDIPRVLYGAFSDTRPELSEIDPRGGLEDFMRTVGKPENLILIARPFDEDSIAGLVWYSDIVPGLRASANIWVAKRYRKDLAIEIGWLSLRYVFLVFKLEAVFAATPWANVAGYARKLGFVPLVDLPRYNRVGGEIHPMRILKLDRKDFFDG